MSYTLHPAAESVFLESVGYYESKVQGLGQALISEFTALVNLIIDNPSAVSKFLLSHITIEALSTGLVVHSSNSFKQN